MWEYMCGKWDRNDKVSFLETDVVHGYKVNRLTGGHTIIGGLANR